MVEDCNTSSVAVHLFRVHFAIRRIREKFIYLTGHVFRRRITAMPWEELDVLHLVIPIKVLLKRLEVLHSVLTFLRTQLTKFTLTILTCSEQCDSRLNVLTELKRATAVFGQTTQAEKA